MFRDQRFRILGSPLQRWEIREAARISQSNADISEESPALDSLDRRAPEKGAKLHVVQGEVITQRHADLRPGRERSFARDGGETIPGAGV
jgi:hypothetical protein